MATTIQPAFLTLNFTTSVCARNRRAPAFRVQRTLIDTDTPCTLGRVIVQHFKEGGFSIRFLLIQDDVALGEECTAQDPVVRYQNDNDFDRGQVFAKSGCVDRDEYNPCNEIDEHTKGNEFCLVVVFGELPAFKSTDKADECEEGDVS